MQREPTRHAATTARSHAAATARSLFFKSPHGQCHQTEQWWRLLDLWVGEAFQLFSRDDAHCYVNSGFGGVVSTRQGFFTSAGHFARLRNKT